MSRKLDTVSLNGLLEALVNGNLSHLQRRELKRHMLVLAINGIEHVLARERGTIGSDFDQLCAWYYHLSCSFCLNDFDYDKLLLAFEVHLSMDIEMKFEEMSPFELERPQFKKRKAKKNKSEKYDSWKDYSFEYTFEEEEVLSES